ncbi:hypothetical protein V8C86DRAFT_1711349 [Haematococcus lacustris]
MRIGMQALVLAVVLLTAPLLASAAPCRTMFGPSPIPFLFFADPGGFSGTAETKYFGDLLRNETAVSAYFPACGQVAVGIILRQRVALVLTGIGPTNAGMCTQQILDKCPTSVKYAIYHGTSGWSAAVGGIITPPMHADDTTTTCSTANAASAVPRKTVRVGDLCISPISVNWACTQASWSQQCLSSPPGNLCFRPQYNFGPNATFLYGKCFFTSPPQAAMTLSRELMAVARSSRFATNVPVRNAAVATQGTLYWSLMRNGTGLAYPLYTNTTMPTVFSWDTCAEIDAQFFYSGVPWDVTARDWVSEAIRTAGFRANASAMDVVAVSAMEAIGFNQAFEQYNALARVPIGYTSVRGNSNWLHHPVTYSGNGVWDYLSGYHEDFYNGYKYAIASYSALTLTYLQNRCITLHGRAACTFTVNYD